MEWNGAWSDTSAEWTEQIKKNLNYTCDPNDGIFWISFPDFQKLFINVHLCKYNDNFKYSHYRKRETYQGYHLIAADVG